MRLLIRDKSGDRYTVFICCDRCRKLIKKYEFNPARGDVKRSETGKLKDTIRARMIKADMNYCYHCGEKSLKGDGE